MKLIIDIPESPLYRDMYTAICENGYIYDEDNEYIAEAIKNSTPLDNLRTELEYYITHSPYINGCTNCCRLRDDILRIVDKYKE